MNRLDSILASLQARADCELRPPTTLPRVPEGLWLPPDIEAFYARFSEARLFDPSDPCCHILPPAEFVQIGIAMRGKRTRNELQQSWFALAHVRDGNYFAIDLCPSRLGWCYDVFHEDFFDSPDRCKIISLSFTELLTAVAAAGDDCWWLGETFRGYGYGDRPVGTDGIAEA